jgi:hypothetical protein
MGLLGSSFFFDREVAGRNGPEKLFTTIALDLARLSNDLTEAIGLVLKQDHSIASAPLSRQFDELILKHLQQDPGDTVWTFHLQSRHRSASLSLCSW